MKVVKAELKKIFRPVPAFALIVLTTVHLCVLLSEYGMFSERSNRAVTKAQAEVIELYGADLSLEERADLENTVWKKYSDKINEMVRNNETLKGLGVNDYEEYRRLRDETPEGGQVIGMWEFHPYDNIYSWLEQYMLYYDLYMFSDYKIEDLPDYAVKNEFFRLKMEEQAGFYAEMRAGAYGRNERETKRLTEIHKYTPSIVPMDDLYGTVNASLIGASIFSMALIFALCAPVLTRDNHTKAVMLQYSSKSGRKTASKQLAAILISAAVITLTQFLAVFAALSIYGYLPFMKCRFIMLSDAAYLWFDGTIGQYLIYAAFIALLVCAAFALILFIFSKQSVSYIFLLLKGVLATALFGIISRITLFSLSSFNQVDWFKNVLYETVKIPFIEIYFCALLLAASSASVYILIKNKKRDLTA
jgi:hypothetical protein